MISSILSTEMMRTFALIELMRALIYLFVIFRHAQQFFSYMMAVRFYWWKRGPRYTIKCIWGETTDLLQVK
jgi:hypothetical protein